MPSIPSKLLLGLMTVLTSTIPAAAGKAAAEPSCQWYLDHWNSLATTCGAVAALGRGPAAVTISPDGTLDASFQFEFVDQPGNPANGSRMEQYMEDLRRVWLNSAPGIDVCGATDWQLGEGALEAVERLPSGPVDSAAVRVCVFDRQVSQGPEKGLACISAPFQTGGVRRGLMLLFPQGDPTPGATFAHEVGHTLGLVDTYVQEGNEVHSNENGFVMSGVGEGVKQAYLAAIATSFLQCRVGMVADYSDRQSTTSCNGKIDVSAPMHWEASGWTGNWATWDSDAYYYVLSRGLALNVATEGGCNTGYVPNEVGTMQASGEGEYLTVDAAWEGDPTDCAAPQDELIYYADDTPIMRFGWLSWSADASVDGLTQTCSGWGQDGCCNQWQATAFESPLWFGDSSQNVVYDEVPIAGGSASFDYTRVLDHSVYPCSPCDENPEQISDWTSQRTLRFTFALGVR